MPDLQSPLHHKQSFTNIQLQNTDTEQCIDTIEYIKNQIKERKEGMGGELLDFHGDTY